MRHDYQDVLANKDQKFSLRKKTWSEWVKIFSLNDQILVYSRELGLNCELFYYTFYSLLIHKIPHFSYIADIAVLIERFTQIQSLKP